jgi:hypothetical protein
MPNAKYATKNPAQAATVLRIIARVFGLAVVVFFLTIVFSSGAQDGFKLDILYILIPVVLAAAAYIIAWWREMLGGILMLAAYLLIALAPNIQSLIIGKGLQFYTGIFIYGSPFLITGILFIVAACLYRRAARY